MPGGARQRQARSDPDAQPARGFPRLPALRRAAHRPSEQHDQRRGTGLQGSATIAAASDRSDRCMSGGVTVSAHLEPEVIAHVLRALQRCQPAAGAGPAPGRGPGADHLRHRAGQGEVAEHRPAVGDGHADRGPAGPRHRAAQGAHRHQRGPTSPTRALPVPAICSTSTRSAGCSQLRPSGR